MEYRINLSGMEFRAFHGCYDLEQQVGNRFTVDVEITAGLGRVAEEDDVNLAVNYLKVYETVREVMGLTQRTIERVAQNIIDTLCARFPSIVHVRCTVAKMAPPLGGKVHHVSVTLEK